MAKEIYTVLVADDSEDDRLFLRRALRKHPRYVLVGEVGDGEAAVAWLSGRGEYPTAKSIPFPIFSCSI